MVRDYRIRHDGTMPKHQTQSNMSIEFAKEIRPKSVAEYGRIVFSHYAARDAEGYVSQPNWVVYTSRHDSDGEWSGLDKVVDIIPALHGEIPPPTEHLPRHVACHPMDAQTVATRLGYSCDRYEFKLDFTGAYTAAFIRTTKS